MPTPPPRRSILPLIALTCALLPATIPPVAVAQDDPKPEEPAEKKDAKPALLPDAALEAAVRKELRTMEGEALKAEDLRDLYFLRAPGAGIETLDGLERCVNLALIDLSGNKVSTLDPLAPLVDVQSLDLSENAIGSLDPLAELTKLQYLKVDGNQIADLGPLAGMEKLSALYASGNKIVDLGPLEGLARLTSLDLSGNAVKDLGPLSESNWLSALTLSENEIENVAPLAGLSELRFLVLKGNRIADLAPLVAAAKEDAAGPRRFAPYLRLYLTRNPLGEAAEGQIKELKAAGVRVILDEPKDAGDE